MRQHFLRQDDTGIQCPLRQPTPKRNDGLLDRQVSIDLEHRIPSCTGRFQRHGSHWSCDRCDAVFYHCSDVEDAVITEAHMEALLRRLGDYGEAE